MVALNQSLFRLSMTDSNFKEVIASADSEDHVREKEKRSGANAWNICRSPQFLQNENVYAKICLDTAQNVRTSASIQPTQQQLCWFKRADDSGMVSTEIADRAVEVLERENQALRAELTNLSRQDNEVQDAEDDDDEGTSDVPRMDAAWAAAFAMVPEAAALQASGNLDFRKYRGGLYGFGNGLFRASLHLS